MPSSVTTPNGQALRLLLLPRGCPLHSQAARDGPAVGSATAAAVSARSASAPLPSITRRLMRAAAFNSLGGPEVLVPVLWSEPSAAPGRVLVRVIAAGEQMRGFVLPGGRAANLRCVLPRPASCASCCSSSLRSLLSTSAALQASTLLTVKCELGRHSHSPRSPGCQRSLEATWRGWWSRRGPIRASSR